MPKILLESELLNRIDKLKEIMVNNAIRNGLNSSETIRCSQELDKLLNLHMRHFSIKEKLTLKSVS